ncbi:MAG: c-type cytochrome biogenesis protein CcsB [Candidatus Krumholzibacteriia bacterium]
MHSETFDIKLFWYAYWLYLASFLLFSVYGATRGRGVGRVANTALAAGFVLHTLGIAWRWSLSRHVPMSNMYEYATLLAWMAVLSYLYIEWRYRKTIVGTFVAPVVVAVMTCASLLPKDVTQQLVPALQSYWLWIHVSLAALGEGAFAVAFAVSIMYLFKEATSRDGTTSATRASTRMSALEKRAAASRQLQSAGRGPAAAGVSVLDAGEPDDAIDQLLDDVRGSGRRGAAAGESGVLPSRDLLDEINYRAIAIGYPLFTIGALFAGAIWAYEAWGSFWSWDPKEVGALIIWFFYTAYLHARLQRSWSGRRAAWLSVAGFSIVILSFLGNLWLGGNHAYT